jgi:putative tricarboxylic transport membrane protein
MGRQRAAGLIFLAIGIYGLIFSVPLPWGTWEEPGPGLFPLAVSLLLSLAGIMKIFQDKGKEEGGRTDWRRIARGFLTPMKILGVTLTFILVLERLGYLLATPLFMFTLLLWVCRYRIRVALVLSLVIGVGSWYLFDQILGIQLPQGILRFL